MKKKKKNNNEFKSLTYVHEMGHVSESISHNDNFGIILNFIRKFVQINIYTPVDYKTESVTYCGMELTDNPYFDM